MRRATWLLAPRRRRRGFAQRERNGHWLAPLVQLGWRLPRWSSASLTAAEAQSGGGTQGGERGAGVGPRQGAGRGHLPSQGSPSGAPRRPPTPSTRQTRRRRRRLPGQGPRGRTGGHSYRSAGEPLATASDPTEHGRGGRAGGRPLEPAATPRVRGCQGAREGEKPGWLRLAAAAGTGGAARCCAAAAAASDSHPLPLGAGCLAGTPLPLRPHPALQVGSAASPSHLPPSPAPAPFPDRTQNKAAHLPALAGASPVQVPLPHLPPGEGGPSPPHLPPVLPGLPSYGHGGWVVSCLRAPQAYGGPSL